MFRRIRDILAVSLFGLTLSVGPYSDVARADLKGIEITSDTPLPMYHVSSSTLNLQSNTALQGIPDLSQDLISGNVYTCHAHLIGSSDTSTTIGGIQVSLAGTNGLTASPFKSSTIVYNSTAAVANNSASSLGNMVSFTGRYTDVVMDASFSATHSGTVQLQAAQVASDATITSVAQGSTFNCIHTPGTIAQVIQQGTPPMSAPFSGGASPNGNNYATGCNLGSCLAAEDVFQTTTLNTTAWNPYYASGAATGTYTRNVDTGGLALGGTDSASYNTHCTGVSSATNPPYTGCGTGALSSSPLFYGNITFTDTYFHADTTHLFGDGFQWNFAATPAMAPGTTTCATDTACAKGAVWKSGAISSATGCAAYSANCFVLPNTGGYIQIRAKMPDVTAGTLPSISLLANSAGTAESGYEIDLHQGGFGYTTAANVAVPTNRVLTTAYRTQGAQLQTNNGFPYTYTLNAVTSYLDFTPSGGPPAVLQVGMNVFDISNPTNITNTNAGFANLACITNISAPFVQLGDCFGGDITVSNTLGASTDDLKMGIGQVQNFSCVTNTTDGTLNMTPWDHESASTDGGNFSCARDMGAGNDLNAAYHIYGIEYLPGSSITVYMDNVQVAKWSGQGIGTSAYDVVMYLDVANSTAANGNFHLAEAWPTTAPPAAAPALSYTMQVNDVQLYKAPTGSTSVGNQAVALNAPNILSAATSNVTQNGAYSSGCSGSPGAASSIGANHSCLNFDDHWTSSTLNLSNWAPGIFVCNNDQNGTATQNCGMLYDGVASNNIPLPLTAWCVFATCYNSVHLDYPYNPTAPPTGMNLNGFEPLKVVGDGSLRFGVQYFYPQTPPDNNGNVPNGTSAFCHSTDCQWLNWISADITAGGLSPNLTTYPATVNNLNAIIPAAGGIMQFRMKTDNGVVNGSYPGFQCSAVGGIYPDTNTNVNPNLDSNANWEWGYLQTAPGPTSFTSFGLGLNDVAVQNTDNGQFATNEYVTWGDADPDGTPHTNLSGDVRNWHTYGIEWTGPATHQWWWYIDGVPQKVSTHNETRFDSTSNMKGWSCTMSQEIVSTSPPSPLNAQNFHSIWPKNADGSAQVPGPFYMYISDFQIWKKPGT